MNPTDAITPAIMYLKLEVTYPTKSAAALDTCDDTSATTDNSLKLPK